MHSFLLAWRVRELLGSRMPNVEPGRPTDHRTTAFTGLIPKFPSRTWGWKKGRKEKIECLVLSEDGRLSNF